MFGEFPAVVVVGLLNAIRRDEMSGGGAEAVKLLGEKKRGGDEGKEEERHEPSREWR